MPPTLGTLEASDLQAAEGLLDRELGGRRQVRLGETVDVLALHGIGAWCDDRIVGIVTWRRRGPDPG